MASLPEALARGLGTHIVRGVAVKQIAHLPMRRFRVDTPRGAIACDGVVVATPAWQAPELIEPLSPELAAGLADVTHTALDCVTLAWPRPEVPHALDGTGWVAGDDRRPTLACTWSSVKWPGRAPAGFVLMRSVLALRDADERELIAAACDDLRDLVGVATAPRMVRVRRLARATPVCEVGHGDRMARLAAAAADRGPLALAGNAHAGLGVPDCIASGAAAARAVLAAVG
jgi:oxygen-dependent protoporphyrinogen oxidase